jgi:hypothetical protein
MAEHAPTFGIKTIDLGKGMFEQKRRFMNASVPLAAGSVGLPSIRFAYRTARRHISSLLKATHLHGFVQKTRRFLQKQSGA